MKAICVSVLPKETEFGRKREIDQSQLQQGLLLRQGLLPELRHRARRRAAQGQERRRRRESTGQPAACRRSRPTSTQPWNILITGVGGTGVVTIGALLGMAGHLEGKGASVLDQTGLAQKGGAVTTHIRIARSPDDIHAVRIAAGEADLVLGCDMVVVNDYWALSKIRAGRTQVVLNTYEAMPGTFTTRPDMEFPAAGHRRGGRRIALGGRRRRMLVDATQLATALMGDAIATNLFMLGYAWQQGLVPLSFDAIMRAVELNGAAIEMNKTAFAWGRLAAVDADAVLEAAGIVRNARPSPRPRRTSCRCCRRANGKASESGLSERSRATPRDEDELRHAAGASAATQCRLPAARRRAPVAFARRTDRAPRRVPHRLPERRLRAALQRPGRQGARRRAGSARRARTDLTEAVARYFFKLMAYKDEYEVARLYTSGDFKRKLRAAVRRRLQAALPPGAAAAGEEGRRRPPAQAGIRPVGVHRVQAAGEAARFLRGSALDIFGYTAERKGERQLIARLRERRSATCCDALDRRQRARWPREIASDPGTHPRLRPRQGSAPAQGQGARGGVAGQVEEPAARSAGAGGVGPIYEFILRLEDGSRTSTPRKIFMPRHPGESKSSRRDVRSYSLRIA